MKKVVILNKKEGETPLEALEFFRKKHKEYKNISMTYAGRLDPMASGVLIILAGEETKKKEKYLALEKEYEFEVLFGVATDTYDILGKIVFTRSHLAVIKNQKELTQEIKKNLKHFIGKFKQTYPIYSSKTVQGKPLFVYARAGEEVKIPNREVLVKTLKFMKIKQITKKNLLKQIEKRIVKVKGDFRQAEILNIWREKLSESMQDKFFLVSFKIKCSSGTYVRVIANSLGERLGIGALAFKIHRTKVGKYATIKK